MHDSSSHEQAGLCLDNSDAQSFVDVHVAPGGKTHAYFDNNNYSFNSNNNNNNYIDTFDSKVDDLNSGINFKVTSEEMTLGRGKSFVSSPSLNHKSIDIDNDNNDDDDNRAMIIEERKSLADYFGDNAGQVAPMYDKDGEKKSESKNNITDYYERYSVETAKILINTLFLPSQKICQYCANAKNNSVVYSDRLIYKKKSLDAKLVNYHYQFYTNQLLLYDDNLLINDNNQDYMPIFNVSKTNHSGLCYSQVDKRDIFNYKTLGPSILLLDTGKIDNYLNTNTDYYHRQMIASCCRVSRNVIFKPKVFQNINYQFKLINDGDNEAKDVDCDEEIQYWMDFNEDARLLNTKNNNNSTNDMFNLSAARLHNHRASLLMLEPILIMPDFTEPRRSDKNRITHSEHVKIVRIVIAYTLSFFLLAIVTFYIVYFA